MDDRIYRLSDVIQRTGVSRSTIYNWVKSNTFPAPRRLGKRLIVWSEADLESWLEAQLSPSELTKNDLQNTPEARGTSDEG